jgi:uncharacterized protein (DUF3084 family)
MELSPGVLALIGTLLGGVALKLVESWLSRSRNKVDDATQLRKELKEQVDARNEEIEKVEAERDKWRGLYYDLRDEKTLLEVELRILRQQLGIPAPEPKPKPLPES